MGAKLKSAKDIQKLIDFIANYYSQDDIFSLGRNVDIDKISYFGFGMNNMQLSESFITRVVQHNKAEDIVELIRNHEYLKRPQFNELFELEETTEHPSAKSILDSLHAIIIGVNDYSNVSNFDSLTYSSKDAQDVRDTIKNQWGVNNANLHLINQNNNTTYDFIRHIIESVIPNLTKNDNLLFYFSGHGDEINGNSYLILSNSIENTSLGKYENAIMLDELNDLFKQCKAKIKFRIFDACRCGQSFSKGRSKSMTPKIKSDMFGSGNGWITITSCNIDESSYEMSNLKNGVFTHFLIEGLKGKARRGHGKMHIEDLKIYVADNVPKNTSHDQNPQYHCDIEGNIYVE